MPASFKLALYLWISLLRVFVEAVLDLNGGRLDPLIAYFSSITFLITGAKKKVVACFCLTAPEFTA